VSNGTLGMLIFTLAETMLFAGLISAFTIARAAVAVWPPPDQPRLPAMATALNTFALLLSGVVLYQAARMYRENPARAQKPLLLAAALGTFFVVFQGAEWVALLGQGLTLTSSQHGSFFYLIVGIHGLHAVGAIAVLINCAVLLHQGRLSASRFGAAQVLWYFVVGIWPFLYLRVYL
jgi:heme/copper-type cytochrome/quinol oxidase subunit 3